MIIAFETQQAYRDYVYKVAGRAMYSKTPQTNTGFHALGIPEPAHLLIFQSLWRITQV